MADDIDRATEQYDFLFERSMANRRALSDQPSEPECLECGCDIPERRRSIGGVKFCFDCQSEMERKR